GMGSALKLVFIGDGAAWVWEVARVNFPGAVHILDFYHAAEHLAELCGALYGEASEKSKLQDDLWRTRLKEDGIDEVIAAARAALPRNGPRRKKAKKQIAYLQRNRDRMLYATFRAAGYFIGSGVVEAGCRTVVGQRLKQSGMFWSSPGAQNVLSVRSALLSNRFDGYWDQRNASNEPLAQAA
ncbi:MAG: ISKra4 family transposase, partial [Verrucomicrobiota bacterium]